jgi:hypothetical protein
MPRFPYRNIAGSDAPTLKRKIHMARRLLSTVLAASLALTSVSTVPAQAADQEEIARFILGASALFLIGRSLEDNNDRRQTVRRTVDPRPQINRKALPSDCLRRARTNDGPRRFFGKRCLKNQYRYTASLPDRCERLFRTNNGKRRGYAANCLRKRGYHIAW